MKIALAAVMLAFAIPATAQESQPWRAVDAETGTIRDAQGLRQLAEDFPDSSSVRLRLLNAQLGEGDVEGLLESLRWLKQRGYVFSETARAQIPELVGEEHANAARALLLTEAEPIEASEVVATAPAEAGLVEGIFVIEGSPAEGDYSMIVTSVTGNSTHVHEPGAGWIEVKVPGANDLSGIVGEPDDSMGWVASSNIDESDDPEPLFSGLMGLRGSFENPILVPAPDGVVLSDITIGADFTAYASDPLNGGIYRKPRGGTQVEVLFEPGTFRSPQGLAVSDDGAHLYVSDYRYGLARIALASGTVERIASDVPVILDGVDGLWLHEGKLVAVQNGTSPIRISAFTLSGDGSRIIAARTLEQAHPGWTEPLGGSVAGGALYYIATGQWDRYVKGEPAAEKPPIPTEIRRLPLGSSED